MKMTPEDRKALAEIKQDPDMKEMIRGLSDEQILAQYRFFEDGEGIDVYDSEEAYIAAMKKRNMDEIEEI